MLVALSSACWAADETVIDGVVHVRNGAAPENGVETRRMAELWRAGGGEDEALFGVINQALADESGNLYLLDVQLCQVFVYSPDGRLLRTIGREGEGPGEFRRPTDLLLLPGHKLGVVQAMPSKIIVFDIGGTPSGDIAVGGSQATSGPGALEDVQARGEHLIAAGRQMLRGETGFDRVLFLASFNPDGSEKLRFFESRGPDTVTQRKFVERDEYSVGHGGYALGRDGTVYVAKERNRYAIFVYSPGGTLERVIEREFRPWKRTAEEKGQVGEGMLVMINGQRVALDVEAEDDDPCIIDMRVADNGELWVLSGRGTREQPTGILRTYDVFDPQGHFVRQVAFAGEGDRESDRFYVVSADRAILVKGFRDAVRAHIGSANSRADSQKEGDSGTLAADAAPLEVICFAVEPVR